MVAECFAMHGYELVLSSGESISEVSIDLYVAKGQMSFEDQPIDAGDIIGRLRYFHVEEGPSLLACYIGLQDDLYNEVWTQVRTNMFKGCTLTLQLGLQYAGDDPVWEVVESLFVIGASFRFIYPRRLPG
jgi:hypothetical protein